MSMYTKYTKTSGDIYFLNDDNIAFDKNGMSCAAGFNAIASQEEFTEVYTEVKTVSSDFYALSSGVEISVAALDGKIEGVSAVADSKFLHLSGGVVDRLSVNTGLTAHGPVSTDYVKIGEHGDISINGTSGANHGSLNIDFENGINNISVNGRTLSSYIDGSINGTVLDYDENTQCIRLINTQTGLSSAFDAKMFIKDGMIDSVLTASGGADISGHHIYPVENGPYVQIIWNTDSGKADTWLEIRKFANLYRAEDGSGILAGQLSSDYKIGVDWDEVARKAPVDNLLAYAAELSAPDGILDTISARVDSALSSTVLTVKFLGHITLYEEEPRRSFIQILEDAGLFVEQRRVKNGSMF